jgi:hypothetical protein
LAHLNCGKRGSIRSGYADINTMDTAPATKLFTEVTPVKASSLPPPGTPLFQAHLDELIAAAMEIIDSTPEWKHKGRYHHIVDVSERMDWRGKRNWFLRKSIHKDVSFEVFKVALFPSMIDGRKGYWRITQQTRKSSSRLLKRQNSLKRLNPAYWKVSLHLAEC